MVGVNALDASKVGDISALRRLGTLNEKLTDRHGANCIHYAARGGSVTVLEFLVRECGFSIFTRSKTGASALHDAAARGNTAVVKWILNNTDIKVDDQDGAGITGLHLAARYGHFLTVEWMIDEAESDVSIRTAGGALPLHFAVVGADLNCVKILVEENPGLINMQMNNGTTGVYLACQGGHLEVLKFLVGRNGATKIKAYDGMSCLHAAAQMGHLDVVQWLIKEEKMIPNDRDFDGLTPLHYAASRGHADVVQWLMNDGNSRVTLDNLGGSPLHNAAEHSENECIQALLDSGCDISLTDNDGLTAAELADNCQHLVSASLIRGLDPPPTTTTTNSFDAYLAQRSQNEPPATSPSLVFPPPPAYPPGDESLSPRSLYYSSTTTNNNNNNNRFGHSNSSNSNKTGSRFIAPATTTATTNTSFLSEEEDVNNSKDYSERYPSPPLPPPPPAFSPPLSSPSTVGSPISPPSPIHGGSWVVEEQQNHHPGSSHFNFDSPKPDYSRYYSNDSVDVGEVVHIVHAEVHKTNNTHQGTPASLKTAKAQQSDRSATASSTQQNYTKSISNTYNPSVIPSSFSFPPPPPPLAQQEIITDYNNRTPGSFKASPAQFPPPPSSDNPPQSKDATYSPAQTITRERSSFVSTNSNSSKISQFKALFESKMSTSNENPSSKRSSFTIQPLRSREDAAPQGASVININGNKATIVNTSSQHNAVSNGGEKPLSPPSSPLPPPPGPPPPLLPKGNRNSAEITINGQSHVSNSDLPPTPTSPSTPSPSVNNTSVSVNGTVPSSPTPPSPVQHNHSVSKHNLISDIQSAISGTSNLSLRSVKSRGDGVSMVHRSSKKKKENGNAADRNDQIQNNVLTGEFDPNNFLDKVETVDASGRIIPEWRRHVLAKHAAEKALKEFEERKKVDDYESRFKDMPAWKRALIEKREGIAREGK